MKTVVRWALVGALLLCASPSQAEPCGSPGAQPPPNCIDCSVAGGCTVNKYGLTHPDNYDFRKPNDPLALDDSDFPTGSYFLSRSTLSGLGTGCGPERDFTPIQGQAVLREQTNCTPTGIGPACAGGANVGKNCHLGLSAALAELECPGSTCVDSGGGCPVEIPLATSGVTHPRDKTTWSNGIFSVGATRTIGSSSSAVLGGTSNPANPQCLASNIRLIPAQGTRYLLSEPRRTALGLPVGATYIQWLDVAGRGLYRHEDDSEFCCTSPTGTACNVAPGNFTEYPILLVRNCGIAGRIFQLLQTNDWIFEGGRGTRFRSDPEHLIPGEVHGVCTNNRFVACTRPGTNSVCTGNRAPHDCCTGPGAGTCGTECAALGDTCDLRERGVRQTIPANQANGNPDPTRCSTVMAVLRGTPSQYCTINTKYAVNGDPGQECLIWNFGFRARPDLNCDGTEDPIANGGDLCPFNNEFDYFKDTDGDCSGVRCRGDECECGDQNLDGRVNVGDLVAINLAIFDPFLKNTICDANNDLACNVSDIVSANTEIFTPDSSTCRHITSSLCGNNVVDANELCDNGARCQGGSQNGQACNAAGTNTCTGGICLRLGGDGCNPSCRVEAGWTCTGSPSVCTRP
jgi:hypothetical protein